MQWFGAYKLTGFMFECFSAWQIRFVLLQDILKTEKPPIKLIGDAGTAGKPFTSYGLESCLSQVIERSDDELGNCNGSGCSKHGIHFSKCICKTHPVKLLDAKQLYGAFHFLEDYDLTNLGSNSKRHAYYNHYAVNIYLTNGKGNRAYLPICLKT